MHISKKHLLIALSALLFGGVASIGVYTISAQSDTNGAQTTYATPTAVSVTDMSSSTGGAVQVSGEVESRSQASISAERSGIVRAVTVEVGDRVAQGQILVRLDDEEARADLSQAKASLNAAQTQATSTDIRRENIQYALSDAIENGRSTIENVVTTKLTDFFSDQDDLQGFGITIRQGSTQYLIKANDVDDSRAIYNSAREVQDAREEIRTTQASSSIQSAIVVERGLVTTRDLVNAISNVLQNYSADNTNEQSVFNPYKNNLSSAQSSINTSLTSLRTAIQKYRDAQVSDFVAQIEQASAQVDASEARLARSYIRAPFSGTITDVVPRIGETVINGERLVAIVNKNTLQISAGVSPDAARSISVGDPVVIADQYKGRVSAISSAINEATGKVELRVAVTDSNANLIVGEFVSMRISTENNTSQKGGDIFVPLTAVRTIGAGASVFIIEDSKARQIPVTTGRISAESIAITSGLEGVQEVITNAASVENGDPVEVVYNEYE